MPKYIIDFEFAGHVEVKTKTIEEGKEIVERMDIKRLLGHVQNFNAGKYYIAETN